jgi:beta-ureidopropionase
MGSDEHEDVVVRDLDLDMLRQVRNTWQFYRDRRPDSYHAITRP